MVYFYTADRSRKQVHPIPELNEDTISDIRMCTVRVKLPIHDRQSHILPLLCAIQNPSNIKETRNTKESLGPDVS